MKLFELAALNFWGKNEDLKDDASHKTTGKDCRNRPYVSINGPGGCSPSAEQSTFNVPDDCSRTHTIPQTGTKRNTIRTGKDGKNSRNKKNKRVLVHRRSVVGCSFIDERAS